MNCEPQVLELRLISWDLGQTRGRSMRGLYQHYYSVVEGIIFVLDSADTDRLGAAREELLQLLQEPELSGRPV